MGKVFFEAKQKYKRYTLYWCKEKSKRKPKLFFSHFIDSTKNYHVEKTAAR